jgi:UDP-glucosyl transferase 73C
MITWPLFSEQFYNEKFVVQVLRTGVSVGAEHAIKWGDEENYGVMVKSEDVKKAMELLMDEGDWEGEKRRKRARELAEMAKKAAGGGSSYQNITLLIEDIRKHAIANKAKTCLPMGA